MQNYDFFPFKGKKKGVFCLLLCLISMFMAPLPSDAQTQGNETQTKKKETVSKTLDLITSISGYIFMYSEAVHATLDKLVEISYANKTGDQLLDELCKKMGYGYKKEGKQVVLSLLPQPTSKNTNSQNQTKRTLTGVIKDAISLDPIPGAVLQIKGSYQGVATDKDGQYSIQVTSKDELIVSCLGYHNKTVLVGDLGVLDIMLEPEKQELAEVVIIGAGQQRKVSVTGAITSTKGVFLKAPTSNLTSNLAGQLAGVVSIVNSGEPGTGAEFYIRGISTFGGRSTPLILLDGVEISSSDLDNIPAESIESFSILKDASATAIYGARGANGVMLVTTKSGTENTKARINVSVENSVVQPVNVIDYVGGVKWMEIYNEATLARNSMAELKYSDDRINYTRQRINPYVFPDVDWYDIIFKDFAMNQRANINVQGGGSKVTYYMSIQANHDTGLLDIPKNYSFDNNINRWNYTFQNNISYKITPTTKVDLRMNAQIGTRKSPNTSTTEIFNQVYRSNPVTFPAVFPAEDDDKHIRFGSAVMSSSRYFENPYATMLNSFREENTNTLNTSLNIDQKLDFITKGLSVTALVNFKNYSQSAYSRSLKPYYYSVVNGSWDESSPNSFVLSQLQQGTEFIEQSGISRYNDNTFYFDARINYIRNFGDHSVSGMLMYMQRQYRSDVLPQRNQGISGRFTYDYKNRYLVEVNFGYNGTERLKKGNRFELFPAISLGWVISNENFMTSVASAINYLKLRASYGLVGSDETGLQAGASHFLYIDQILLNGGYMFSSGPAGGYRPATGSPVVTKYKVENARWEVARKFNVGLDFRLFNMFDVTVDYFYDRRSRILMKREMFPDIMGYYYDVPWSNIGKVDNQGVEFSINWNKKIADDFFIDFRGNFTYTSNKYVYVDEPNYPHVWQTKTGRPLSTTVGYVADGLFSSQEEIDIWADQSSFGSVIMPGDIKYRDINGDGKISEEDQVMLSSYGNVPRMQYGLGLNIQYKRFDFGIFFTGSAMREIMINGISPFCANDTNERNLMSFIADDYWSVNNPNPNAKYPRLGVLNSQITNNMQPSSYWMRNAGFIRFKTLELGYNFPHCRIYINGDNIAVWSPFKLWDPSLWYNSYPLQRTFNIGAQLKF